MNLVFRLLVVDPSLWEYKSAVDCERLDFCPVWQINQGGFQLNLYCRPACYPIIMGKITNCNSVFNKKRLYLNLSQRKLHLEWKEPTVTSKSVLLYDFCIAWEKQENNPLWTDQHTGILINLQQMIQNFQVMTFTQVTMHMWCAAWYDCIVIPSLN